MNEYRSGVSPISIRRFFQLSLLRTQVLFRSSL